MKAPPFGYVRATSLADAFQLWRDAGPEAKLLAGGQSLLATLAFRLSEPSTLIDISRVRGAARHRRRPAPRSASARSPPTPSSAPTTWCASTCRCSPRPCR